MKTILKALFTISLALFSFLLPVYSSNPVIDSLENQILLHNQDEALVQTYSRLYTQYLHLDNKKAMEYAGKAFELSKKLKYPRGLANSYNNLGLGFLYQGATEKALEYFQKALTIDAEENFIKGMAPTVLNIGIIYGNMGELEKSLDYFKRYKEMAEELGVKDLSAAHTNIGVSYSQMGCFKEALEQFEIVDSIANALGKEAQIVRNLDKMALLHYNQGMYPESIEYGNKALKANDKLGSKSVLMNANRIMGGAYFKLKKEDLAIKHLEISNRVAKEMGENTQMIDNYSFLYRALAQKKNYKHSYEVFSKYISLKDSLEEIGNKDRIKEMQAEFESERQAAQIELLKKDQLIKEGQLKENRLITGLIISILLMGLVMSIILARNKINTQKQELTISQQATELNRQKIEDMEKEQRLKTLNSHIEGQSAERKRIAKDLHDGLGTDLASIKLHMIGLQNSSNLLQLDDLISSLDKTCKDVRAIAHHLHPPEFSHTPFHLILDKQVRSLGLNQKAKILLDYTSSEELNNLPLSHKVEIYRIVQESIHNSLKHGKPRPASISLA